MYPETSTIISWMWPRDFADQVTSPNGVGGKARDPRDPVVTWDFP